MPLLSPTHKIPLERCVLLTLLSLAVCQPCPRLLAADPEPRPRLAAELVSEETFGLEGLNSLPKTDNDAQIKAGLQALLTGNYQEAVAAADKVLQQFPRHILAHEMKAAALVKTGKLDEGMKTLEAALPFAPQPALLLRKMGDACLLLKQHEKAETLFQRALKLDPADAQTHQRMGYIQERNGKLDLAIASYQLGLKGAPENYLGVNVNLGRLYNLSARFGETVGLLEKPVGLDRHTPLAHTVLGLAYLGLTRYPEAIRHLETAVRLEPSNIDSITDLATAYQRGSYPQKARAAVQQIIKLRPDWPAAYQLLGDLDLAQGNPEGGLQNYEKAAGLSSDPAPLKLRVGQLLLALKRAPQAVALLDELAKTPNASFPILDSLAEAHLANNQPKLAEATLASACAKFPQRPEPFYRFGVLLTQLGRSEDAIAQFQKALAILPNDDSLLRTISQTHAQAGRPAKAVEFAEKAAAAKPGNPDNQIYLAARLREAGQVDRAVKLYEGLLKSNPKLLAAQHNLAVIYSEIGRTNQAVQLAERILRESPDIDPSLKVNLAGIFHDAGAAKQARKIHEDILTKTPTHVPTLNNHALLLAEAGERDRALELALKAWELAPQEAKVLDTVGWIHFQRGEFQEAASWLEKALQIEPQDPTLLYHLGMAYHKTSRFPEAAKSFNDALAASTTFPERAKTAAMKQELERTRP